MAFKSSLETATWNLSEHRSRRQKSFSGCPEILKLGDCKRQVRGLLCKASSYFTYHGATATLHAATQKRAVVLVCLDILHSEENQGVKLAEVYNPVHNVAVMGTKVRGGRSSHAHVNKYNCGCGDDLVEDWCLGRPYSPSLNSNIQCCRGKDGSC